MDWIERLFHVSPDGGSGSLEASIVIGAVAAVLVTLAAIAGVRRIVPGRRETPRSSIRLSHS